MTDQSKLNSLFSSAYKEYTDASRRMYLASTPEEKKSAKKDLLVASQNFNDAYNKLKVIKN